MHRPHPKHLRSGAAIAAAIAGASLLTACGFGTAMLDIGKAPPQIRHLLVTQAGVKVKSVHCPSNVDIKKGLVTSCTATLADGDTIRMTVTQVDGKGDVHLGPGEMIAEQIENYIDRQFATKQKVTTTTVCPQHEPVIVGHVFDCVTSDAAGHTVKLAITTRNTSGGFTVSTARAG